MEPKKFLFYVRLLFNAVSILCRFYELIQYLYMMQSFIPRCAASLAISPFRLVKPCYQIVITSDIHVFFAQCA